MQEAPQSDSAALNEIRETLLSIVRTGLAQRPEGVHLTWVGGEFARQKQAPFEQYLNFIIIRDDIRVPLSARKMAPFIQQCCGDLFDIHKISNQTYTLTLKDDASPEEVHVTATPESTKFRRSVWPAFIKPIAEGYRRFLSMDTYLFTDAKRKPAGNWKEIKEEYVAGLGPSAPVESLVIQKSITKWATDNSVDEVDLHATPMEFSTERATLSDLVKIINSLPRAVTADWNIPAEVIRNLRHT